MSGQINHEQMAQTLLEDVISLSSEANAVTHVLLAIAEQLRISNLIEAAQSPLFNGYSGDNQALDALVIKDGGFRPGIAAALGIEVQE